MLRRLAPISVLVASLGSPASAQDPTAEFVALWTEFIEVCGPALAAPDQVLANNQPRPGYESHVYYATPDRSAISVQHFNLNANDYIELSLIRFGARHTLYCDVSRYNETAVYAGRADDVAESIRAIVAQSPGLEIAGGAFDLHPYSRLGQSFYPEDAAYHTTYVIDGVFPDFPLALTQFYIDDYGMYLVLVTSWSVEP